MYGIILFVQGSKTRKYYEMVSKIVTFTVAWQGEVGRNNWGWGCEAEDKTWKRHGDFWDESRFYLF